MLPALLFYHYIHKLSLFTSKARFSYKQMGMTVLGSSDSLFHRPRTTIFMTLNLSNCEAVIERGDISHMRAAKTQMSLCKSAGAPKHSLFRDVYGSPYQNPDLKFRTKCAEKCLYTKEIVDRSEGHLNFNHLKLIRGGFL